MLDTKSCTIAAANDYAQELKRSFDAIQEPIVLQMSQQEFLIEFLKLTHPNGGKIDLNTAEITIARKPPNCVRLGTSQTCYYIRPSDQARPFYPVWLADCRRSIRSERLKESPELVAT